MLVMLFLYATVLAFFLAKLEINIEGKDGWAKNLPTWRMKSPLTDFFFGKNTPLTGYHLWLNLLILGFFHLPFFMGLAWTVSLEFEVLAVYIFFMTMEDFLWFICNPAYGLKKFTKEHISWHGHWIGRIPVGYIKALAICALLLIGSFLLR